MSLIYTSCPYCEEEISLELDGQKQNEKYSEVCDKCKNKFNYYYELSVDIYCSKIEKEQGK